MEKNSKISINLSSNKKVSVGSIFYKWAFQAGRALVVLIELIALGALGYRFLVDGQIIDLHDEIKKQANLVEYQAEKEASYVAMHERLGNIKIITEEAEGKIEVIDEILTTINENEFIDTDLNVNNSSIDISGNAISVFTVENFVNRIKEFPQVNSISINEINSSSNGIKFSIKVTLAETKLKS